MGRWERTHEALAQAALELFAEHGYDATATAQIAERAGVSEMTLFRHFSTKEALLLEDPYNPLIAAAVRSRPPGEPVMRTLVESIRQAWSRIDTEDATALRARLRIVAEATTLRGAVERNSGATVAALIDALADRGVAATEARVAATAVIAGLGVALLEWARSDRITLDTALDQALMVLGGA
ncbi:MAG TPA: helix-turn-helix domain-containing protein [Amycolatopsis sp.]|jgi:AcrR family transcriptional regulator|nr:helix-turn-helix domain-containing protein [Amycolatopsis sp.]